MSLSNGAPHERILRVPTALFRFKRGELRASYCNVRQFETKDNILIKLAQTDNEIADCFQVMRLLRTELVEASFVPLVRELMDDNYQLAYIREKTQVVCIAGFKISKNLFFGKHLYVEDLSTQESERSKGYGKQMMAWLRNLAKTEECSAFHLDSGVQRHQAHKFYLNQNMNIVCYHFAEKLPNTAFKPSASS